MHRLFPARLICYILPATNEHISLSIEQNETIASEVLKVLYDLDGIDKNILGLIMQEIIHRSVALEVNDIKIIRDLCTLREDEIFLGAFPSCLELSVQKVLRDTVTTYKMGLGRKVHVTPPRFTLL